MKKILVTGSAGFIGFHLAKGLLKSGFDVVGVDNLNDYYDPQLKLDRLENLNAFVSEQNFQDSYQFTKLDISDQYALKDIFNQHDFDIVVNLAAQAGVRYSLENPNAYIVSNLVGYANILECCRHANIEHFIFASSSSVYGMNTKQPFSTSDNTDFPISLYAATKKIK
jgi:UDP-glucuronate 4-epimerase